MRVTSLWVYPVKSLGGAPVEEAVVEPWGLAGDRRWGLVDPTGGKVTAREVHGLLALRAVAVGAETIRVTDRDGASILVDAPVGVDPVPVAHSRQGRATPADDDVNEWLSRRVGAPVRLVWQQDPTMRTVDPEHGGMPGEHLSLADAGPLLLTSESSLAQLNAWVAAGADQPDVAGIDPGDLSAGADENQDATLHGAARSLPLAMLRFRPNVVIDGGQPFGEDEWERVRVGDIHFRRSMVCDRCVMTTIDPVTLAGGKEPIRTLARHRRWDGRTWFGIRLVPLGTGTIRVGDLVGDVGEGAGAPRATGRATPPGRR